MVRDRHGSIQKILIDHANYKDRKNDHKQQGA